MKEGRTLDKAPYISAWERICGGCRPFDGSSCSEDKYGTASPWRRIQELSVELNVRLKPV